MAIGLERFRQITSGDRIVLNATQSGGEKRELSLGHKITAWRNGDSFTHGTGTDQTANDNFKTEFRNALVKAEGQTIANLAAARAGLPPNATKRVIRSSGARRKFASRGCTSKKTPGRTFTKVFRRLIVTHTSI